MRIDIWSDIVCPWCWIGKHRLERALALMGNGEADVQVHWHPYLLDPTAGTIPVPLREAYAAKFGGPERTEQLLQQIQSTAQGEGLPMDFSQGQVKVSTLPAHRLMWLAAQHGVQQAVAEALFRAHFEHGGNLADPQTLIDAAAAGGISAALVEELLGSGQGLAEVQAELAQAQAMGISSVPTFVIDGQYAVQGAQPPEALLEIFGKIAAERTPGNEVQTDAACGPEGCQL